MGVFADRPGPPAEEPGGRARRSSDGNVAPAQIALAWVLAHEGVLAIPKGSNLDHVRQNREALDVHLTREDLLELDHGFPPPARKVPLELL